MCHPLSSDIKIDGASGIILCNRLERIVYKLLNLSKGEYKKLPVKLKRADREHSEKTRKPLTGGSSARTMFDNEVRALQDTRGCEQVVDFKGIKENCVNLLCECQWCCYEVNGNVVTVLLL